MSWKITRAIFISLMLISQANAAEKGKVVLLAMDKGEQVTEATYWYCNGQLVSRKPSDSLELDSGVSYYIRGRIGSVSHGETIHVVAGQTATVVMDFSE